MVKGPAKWQANKHRKTAEISLFYPLVMVGAAFSRENPTMWFPQVVSKFTNPSNYIYNYR